jgi:hypothetical protein
MTQPHGGIGNLTPNPAQVQIATSYTRSRLVCAAARLGVADVLQDEVRSVDWLAESCKVDADVLYRLRDLASVGFAEETAPIHFPADLSGHERAITWIHRLI